MLRATKFPGTGSAFYFILPAANSHQSRTLAEDLRKYRFDSPVVTLLTGRPELADSLAETLSSNSHIVRDPKATQIAEAFNIQSTPFALRVEAGKIKLKTYVRTADHFLALVDGMDVPVFRLLNFALLLFLVLLIAACNQNPTLPLTQGLQSAGFVVAGDISGFPDGCSPHQVADLMIQFFAAYNASNQEQPTQFFPPSFEWYSDTITDKSHFVTRPGNRDELLSYFAERHEQNEQLKLQAISVTGPRDGLGGKVNIAFRYKETASTVAAGQLLLLGITVVIVIGL